MSVQVLELKIRNFGERGRGWALWKALISLDHPRPAAESEHVLTTLGLLGA